MNPPRESAVFQLVRSNHELAEAGHKRLRSDYREHEERLIKLESIQGEHSLKLQALASATPELSKMTLSSSTVLTIVIAVVGIVTGQVASTWGLRSDIRDINTNMSAQRVIQDERAARQDSKVDAIDKKQEMLRIVVDELRKEVLERSPRR